MPHPDPSTPIASRVVVPQVVVPRSRRRRGPRPLATLPAVLVGLLLAVVPLPLVPAPGAVMSVGAAPATSPPTSLPVPVDTWAWCGVHPDDPAAAASAQAMAESAGISVTFGPCNVPAPGYSPAFTADRYVSPEVYRRLVEINAAAGLRTVVYDARVWSADPAVRAAAIAFWEPWTDHIEAWDMGDEFDPAGTEWPILVQRWNRVRTLVTPQTGVRPFTNHLYWATDEALRDLPGSEQLLSFTLYGTDLGASVARTHDADVGTLMCGVNAYDHFGYVPSPDKIRADMAALRAAGCDQFLVFGGHPVYASQVFGDWSIVDRQGRPTVWAPAVLEGSGRSSFTGVTPARLLETRAGLTTVDGAQNGVGRRGDGAVSGVDVVGRAGLPWDVAAVALTVTAVDPSRAGFVTIWPCGRAQPVASQLTHARTTAATTVVVEPGQDGRVCVYNMAATDLVVDVNGYVPEGAAFVAGDPARLLETRVGDAAAGEVLTTVDGRDQGIGPREAGTVTEVQVTGRAGVPATARSVVLSVTVTAARAAGYVTVYPCGTPVPVSSNVNYTAGATVTTTVVSPVGTGGRVCLFTMSTVDMVLDIGGHLPALAPISTEPPSRLLDSRSGTGVATTDGRHLAFGPVRPDTVTSFTVAGRAGLPSTVRTVALSVTVTEPVRSGFVTIYPCGSPRPNASHVNFVARQTVANLVFAEVGADGTVCAYSMAGTQLVVDVIGALP